VAAGCWLPRGPLQRCGRGASTDAELRVDVLQVFLDGARRDPELHGDLRVRLAFGYQRYDLALP